MEFPSLSGTRPQSDIALTNTEEVKPNVLVRLAGKVGSLVQSFFALIGVILRSPISFCNWLVTKELPAEPPEDSTASPSDLLTEDPPLTAPEQGPPASPRSIAQRLAQTLPLPTEAAAEEEGNNIIDADRKPNPPAETGSTSSTPRSSSAKQEQTEDSAKRLEKPQGPVAAPRDYPNSAYLHRCTSRVDFDYDDANPMGELAF